MRITRGKPVSLFVSEQLVRYEFCRMDSSKKAIKGACALLSTPFIVSMCFMACGMAKTPEKRQPVKVSKVKIEKEVAPLLDDEMWLEEVHPNPVIEIRKEP